MNHYEVNFEDLCTCFGLDQRIKPLRNIKINQAYMKAHTNTHASTVAETQGQERRFIFIIGKGAKSCWYVGDYINANCIGEPLVLKKVCM